MPLLGKDVSTGRRSTSRRGSSRTDSERQRTHRQRSRRQTPPVAETFLLRSATTALHSDNSSTGLTSVDTEETDRTPVQNLVEQTRLNRHSDARDAQRRRILEANRSNTGPSAIPPSTRARVTRTSIISSLPPIHEHSSSQYTAYRPHGISPLVPRASNARWKVGRHYEQSNSMQTFSSRRRARQTAIRSRQAKRYTHQTGRYVSSRRAADTTPVTAARIYKQLYPGAPSLRRYFHGRQYGTRRDHFGRRVSSTLNLPTFIQQHRDDTTEDWPITASDYFSPRTLEALGVKRGESEDDDEDGLQILKDSDSVSSWYASLVHRHSSPWIRPRTYMFEANEEEILVRKMDLRLLRKYKLYLDKYKLTEMD
jgi:Tfp pilus assembly protein PilV